MSRLCTPYRGHIIEISPYPLRDGGFTVHFDLEQHLQFWVNAHHFETGLRFDSEDEALRAGHLLGRQRINLALGV